MLPDLKAGKTFGIHWFPSKYFLFLRIQVPVILDAKAAARPVCLNELRVGRVHLLGK